MSPGLITMAWRNQTDRFELDAFDLEILAIRKYFIRKNCNTLSEKIAIRRYSRYLSYLKPATTPDGDGELDGLMNGEIKKKFNIIPENVTQSDYVFTQLQGDFMRPKINEVAELLAKRVNVTIYNGQILELLWDQGVWRRNHQLNSCSEGFMLLLTSGR
ncbi:serine carboxypeptidase-like 51 isoform X1 [Pistacia vera]|uniref:serine carboxypeptidase-like 51 isoform X1 n=1 Tax=Pistacia vera TaxID=55513 RepID=UPI001262C254|nr:serine carboxypeptidase-like 51 isoform X1 [Pistacia vera]XP_031260511.1 serine carboxypeptidase-like 51 isoform X1 [Pistacia vera]